MKTLYRGEPLNCALVSFHKRMHCARGEKTIEPPTYWLTFRLPWRMKLWDINTNAWQRAFPCVSVGFRFRVGI